MKRETNPHYGGNGNVPFPQPVLTISQRDRRPGVLSKCLGTSGLCQRCGGRTWVDTDGDGKVVDFQPHTRRPHVCHN